MPNDSTQAPSVPAPGVEPAGAPAAPGQSVGELTARIAGLEESLAGYRVLDPLLAKLGENPDVVTSLFSGSEGVGASAAPTATAPGSPSAAGSGEGQDPRYDTLARELAQLRQQNADLHLDLGLDRCGSEFGADFDRKAVLEAVVKTGIANPRDAYFTLRGQKFSPDYIKGQVDEGVKAELARLSEVKQVSPAGTAGAGGPTPDSGASDNEGLVGPSVKESVIADLRDTGIAAPPASIAVAEGEE